MYFIQNGPCDRARVAFLFSLLLVGRCGVAFADEGDDQYAAAARHYANQSWQPAATAFEAFAADFPQHPRALDAQFFSGEAWLQSKHYAQARQQFLDFIQRAPEHAHAPQAQFRAAETLYLSGDAESASRELKVFSEKYPTAALNAYALAYRAETEFNARRFDEAAAIYRESEKSFPGGPLQQEVRSGLARTLEELGQSEDALQLYASVAKEAPGGLAQNATLRAGVLLYQRGDLDDAVQQLAIFESTFSDSPLKPEARYWTGMATLDNGNPQDAAKIFETATRSAKGSSMLPGLWFGLAKATQAMRDDAGSRAHYQRVVNEWPQSLWADNSLHALLEAAFNRADADQFDAWAAKFEPPIDDGDVAPRITHLLGREALRRQEYQRAIEHLESVAVDGQLESFAQANSYYLSVAHLRAKQFTTALDIASGVDTRPAEAGLRRNLLNVQASALFELERYPEAAQLLTACLRESPPPEQAAQCRAKLAICQARVADIPALRKTLASMRRQDTEAESFLPTIAYIAELMAGADETELARELYAWLTLDGTPNEWVAKGLASLGRMQLERGEIAESTKTFNRLMAKAENTREASKAALLQALALQQADQPDAAVAAYRRISEQHPGTDEAAIAMFEASKLQDRLGQDREAAVLLRQLLEEDSNFEQKDAALYQLAWVLTDLQQDAAAEAAFSELLTAFPKSAFRQDVLYRLAERAFTANELESASDRIRELLAEDVEPLLLGHGLYLQGQIAAKRLAWNEAIPPMQRIVDELPDHALWLPANYWIAEAHFRSGDYDQAAIGFDGLGEATLDSQASWVPMVLLRSAQVAANQERWLDAIDAAQNVALRFPGFRLQHEADYMIGRSLSARGRFSEAREALGRVIRSPIGSNTETAAMAQWMIGESFFHQKEYRYALRAYQRGTNLQSYPRWQSASLLQSGKCHEAVGDWRQAVQCYAELIQHHPTSEFADAASARLRIARREAVSTTTR